MSVSVHDSNQIFVSQFSSVELDRIARQPGGQSRLFALVREGEVDLDDAARAIARAKPSPPSERLRRIAIGLVETLFPASR